MPNKRRFYWDSNVFLTYVNGEPEAHVNEIEPLLDQANQGHFEIVTSTVSIVEVAFAKAEQDNKTLDPQVEARIQNLWGPPVMLIEFYPLIAEDARALMRSALTLGPSDETWSLKGMDAIHLATARRLEATEIHSYDSKLPKFADLVGIPIKEPLATQPQLRPQA